MMTTLATVALTLALAQAPASTGEGPGHAAPAQHGPAATPAEHGRPEVNPPSEAHPETHGAAGAGAAAHEAAGGHDAGGHGKGEHDESLGAVMMHHVVDGDVIEYPGVCEKDGQGGWHWNCEWSLSGTFGTTFKFGALDMTPTKHVIMMWLASALLLLVVLGATRKRSLVPRGVYNFVELLVAFVRNELAVPNIGKENADRFLPYLLTAFFFILFVNLFGLIPWSGTATANVNVTVCLAVFTFLITQYAAIKAMGLGAYLGHLTGGVPKSLWPLWFVMVPVEVLGLFTKPFALTVRLFANMVAGHFVILALLGLIFAISVWVAPASVALALAIFMLELFVAFVQAYIFTMLSALFIGAGLVHHGHDGDHGDAHGHADDGAVEHASHAAGKAPGHG
jgi:F-type H+-transporting ATPase subunit a